MIKYIYKTVILIVVFVGSLFFFGKNLQSSLGSNKTNVSMGTESYPIITLKTQGNDINTLYGYSGAMDPAIVRESITPLGSDKQIVLNITETSVTFEKMEYQIIDRETKEVYEDETINALDGNNKIELAFKYAFETSKEYILSLIATTDSGRRIHYYTRLKSYTDDTHLSEKLKFALQFHKDTFTKSNADELAKSLEIDQNLTNDSLAKVTIKSSSDLVTWGKLRPTVDSDIVPIVKEFNTETACIQLNYYVKATTTLGEERYHVKEFFRVRYASGHNYLLNYERTMDTIYNYSYISTKKGQLKVGITPDSDMDLMTSEDSKDLYFVRNSILYHYNMDNNTMSQIFSLYSEDAPDQYTVNDENDIRMNKLDSDGNLYFTAYGYMPRGQYEGKVAVILYEYIKQTGKVEEQVYLPMDTTYEQMKADFNTYSYVNDKGIYYFTVADTVYAYNMLGKKLEVLLEQVEDSSFIVLRNKATYAYSDNLSTGYGDSITLFNLETDERKEIQAPNAKTYIRLLGTIDSNLIYGLVKKADIKKTKVGTEIVPCYRMIIVDTVGNVLKEYQSRNKYISNVIVEGNVLNMDRVVKNGNGYKEISKDSILNQESTAKKTVSLDSRVTTSLLTEWYISLPSNYVLTSVPKLEKASSQIETNGRAVHLDDPSLIRYYVYALGGIYDSYENPAEAIQVADTQMGVVISSRHQIVWERGGSYLLNSISGIDMTRADSNVSCLAACAQMVLKANHYSVNAKSLTKENLSIYDMLGKYMENPVNLTGATLEQVLYFVSGGKPVIAMTGNNSAVVISEYTQTSLTLLNPNTGKSEVVSRNQWATLFENAGNRFVSYMTD